MHDLPRRALQEREERNDSELYRAIHRALFGWFAGRCSPPDRRQAGLVEERALLAAFRHLVRVDAKEAVRWANRRMQALDDAFKRRPLEELCQITLPLAESAFGAEDDWTTAILAWLASTARCNGRYEDTCITGRASVR